LAAEWIQVLQHAPGESGIALGHGFGVLKEVLQTVRAVIVVVGDVVVANGTDNRHVMLGSGKDNVESFFPAALVDWAEVHEHASSSVMAVADAHDDNVPFVALDVL